MELQRIVELTKQPNETNIQKLVAPWREKFSTLSLDNNSYLYMDDRLVIPKALRAALQRFFYWGHPGGDEVLRKSLGFWWQQIHRDVMPCVKTRKE